MRNLDSSILDLSIWRNKRLRGEVTRDQFWTEVQNDVTVIQSMNLVASRQIEIRIKQGEMLIEYTLNDGSTTVAMVLQPDDLRTAPMTILSEGHYEPVQEDLIVKLACASKTLVDVGANVGFYSTACARTNPNITVLAFEPNPDLTEVFLRNVLLNGVSRQVELHTVALSESGSRTGQLHVPPHTGSGGGSLRNLHPEEGAARVHPIEFNTLEELFPSTQPCDLIKIDVEGNELSVLRGALGLITQHYPTIVIELLRKWMKPFGHHPQDVIGILIPMGYECHAIQPDGLRKIRNITEETSSTNFVFVHQSQERHMALIKTMLKT